MTNPRPTSFYMEKLKSFPQKQEEYNDDHFYYFYSMYLKIWPEQLGKTKNKNDMSRKQKVIKLFFY